MTQPGLATLKAKLNILKTYLWVWVAPSLIFTLLGLGYALVRQPVWEASQALLLRDEAGGGKRSDGEFEDADALQNAQATLNEVCHNHEVVRAALLEAGPESENEKNFPTSEQVLKLRGDITVTAPQGAEFGTSEVLYLKVQGSSPQRAKLLAAAVTNQLEKRLQELRNAKTKSVIDELEKARDLAKNELQAATRELAEIETSVGSDLGELRTLNTSGGDSNLRISLNQIKADLREAQQGAVTSLELKKHLQVALANPQELIAMPNTLFQSQPSLLKLKEGLVAAQLRTAELSGLMSANHPRVQAAKAAETEVRQDLHAELSIALRGLETQIQVNSAQQDSLKKQHDDVTSRLNRLAGMRASYGSLVDDVRQQGAIYEQAKRDLAEAHARHAGAATASLLTRLESPQVGNYPVGPGRTTIVLAGAGGGLLTGLGLVLLFCTPDSRGRRLSDYMGMGRRTSDRAAAGSTAGRRAADSAPGNRRAGDQTPKNRRAEDALPPGGRRAEDRTESEQTERIAADLSVLSSLVKDRTK